MIDGFLCKGVSTRYDGDENSRMNLHTELTEHDLKKTMLHSAATILEYKIGDQRAFHTDLLNANLRKYCSLAD
jgi:hypothetical protein